MIGCQTHFYFMDQQTNQITPPKRKKKNTNNEVFFFLKFIYISKIFTLRLKITDDRRFTEISTISCSSVLITLYDENIFNTFARFRNL